MDVHRCVSEIGQVPGMDEELTQYSMSMEIWVTDCVCLCMNNSQGRIERV